MKTLETLASDEQILAVVREWVEALVRDDYDVAFEITAHDPYYDWSPESMRSVIQNYGSIVPMADGSLYHVTSLADTTGESIPRHEVERMTQPRPVPNTEESVIGHVFFELPLNGEWSDLAATFEVRMSKERLHLVLNDIHVH